MKRTSTGSRDARRSQARSRRNSSRKIALAAVQASLDDITPSTAKAAGLLTLLQSWLHDASGYDEETWPKLKKALDRERDGTGARRLFDD